MKFILLSFLMMASALAQTELDDKGWLQINCHSDDQRSSFSLDVSNSELFGVNQITKVKVKGHLKEVMEFDGKMTKPSSALLKRTGNDLEFEIRFPIGYVGDSFFNMTMKYNPNGYDSKVVLTGEEGEYLNVTDTYQCEIGNHQVYLKTKNYKGIK